MLRHFRLWTDYKKLIEIQARGTNYRLIDGKGSSMKTNTKGKGKTRLLCKRKKG